MTLRDSNTSPSFNLGCPRPYGAIPTLDIDVMEIICDSINGIHDLLAVSLTCSMMRSIAIRQLLRTHTVRLTNRHALRAFHLFILNHKADRAHHIRFLFIPEIVWFGKKIGPGATNDVDKLMDILDCAVNLVHLDLFLRSSESDVDRGRISSAFARMSTLRHLSLRDSDPSGLLEWAQDALSTLRSPPRTLCIEAGDDNMMSALDPQPARLLRAVSRFATSWAVTNLFLACLPMDNNAFLGLPPFRSVRSLTITKPLPVPPKLDSLLHLFPSLDATLRLHLDIPTRMRINKNFTVFSQTKQENTRAQDRSPWTGLDRLDCDTETASMLELRCPVRHLTLDAFVLNVVVHIKPTHLVIAPMSRFPLSLFPSRMDLQTPVASVHTTHVVLIASCNSQDDFNPFRWDAVYERLVQALSLFKNATHARLVFHCTKSGPSRKALVDFIRDMQEHASAEETAPPLSLRAACPKLRYFFLTAAMSYEDSSEATTITSGESQRGWIKARAWRLIKPSGPERGQKPGEASDESAPLLVLAHEEIGEYAAKRVIEVEDLGLPEEWERKLENCRTF